MKTITCIKISILILFSGLFFSCVKEGPQGPAGYDGNANVYSMIYSVKPSAWSVSGNSLIADIQTNWISNSVVDNGSVLVFMEDLTQMNRWQMLPYTWPSDGSSEYFGYWYESGWVTLEINNGTNILPAFPNITYTFKVVAIDGYAAMSNESKKLIINQVMKNTIPSYK